MQAIFMKKELCMATFQKACVEYADWVPLLNTEETIMMALTLTE